MHELYIGVCSMCETYMRVEYGFVGDVGVSEWVSGECAH